MPVEIFQIAAELEKNGQPFAICTIVECKGSIPRKTGSKMIVLQDGKTFGSVGGGEVEDGVIKAVPDVFQENKTRILRVEMVCGQEGGIEACGGEAVVYIEPVFPKKQVIIFGAGHVGKAVVHLAKWLGYRTIMIDDRPDLCSSEIIPEADQVIVGNIESICKDLKISPDSYLVLTTRSVDLDIIIIPMLLQAGVKYIGVIGSRRRWLSTEEKLRQAGIAPEMLKSIKNPIGLDIKAETPEEIALSILGEIIMKGKTNDVQ